MMMADLMKGIAGPIDLKAETNIHLEMTRASVANTISNPLTDDARIHHVPYKDFVSDPIGTIRGYYGFAGRKFTPQAEGAMPNYLFTNNGGNSVSVIDGCDAHRQPPPCPSAATRGPPATPLRSRWRCSPTGTPSATPISTADPSGIDANQSRQLDAERDREPIERFAENIIQKSPWPLQPAELRFAVAVRRECAFRQARQRRPVFGRRLQLAPDARPGQMPLPEATYRVVIGHPNPIVSHIETTPHMVCDPEFDRRIRGLANGELTFEQQFTNHTEHDRVDRVSHRVIDVGHDRENT